MLLCKINLKKIMKINKILNKICEFHIINEVKLDVFSEQYFIKIIVKYYSCKQYPNELKDLQLFLIKQKNLKYSLTLEQ